MAIHPLEQETLQRPVMVAHLVRKSRDRRSEAAHRVGAVGAARLQPPLGFADQVAHHAVDHAADRLVDQTRLIEPRIAPPDLLEHRADQRHLGEIGDREQAGAQPVVEVVVVVGDVVGQRRDLRLGTGNVCRSSGCRASYSAIEGGGSSIAASGPRSGPLCLTVPSSVSQVRFSPSNPA